MSDMLIGISSDFLYIYNESPKPVSDYHRPYFLAFTQNEKDIIKAQKNYLMNGKKIILMIMFFQKL